jgi:Flp pilus assembly protein TadB
MASGGSQPITWLFLAILSFVLAALSLTGVLLHDLPAARWIFGIVFIAIGILWVVRFARPPAKK